MPQAVVNGQTIRYHEQGAGIPLVLIHGFPLDRRIWNAQLNALSDRCRVIAIDLPGFGESRPEKPFTMNSMADDLHGLLTQIKAVPCALAGLSMGGYIAFAYLTKYPADLKGLILVDTKCEADTPEGKEGRNKMIENVRKNGARAIADAMEPKMLAPDTLKNNAQLTRQVRDIMESCPAKTIEHALAAMRDRDDHRDKLASIAVPTLIIVGEHDAITPPQGAINMSKEIPHSKVCVISSAGHLSTMENPDQVNKSMRDFLGELR